MTVIVIINGQRWIGRISHPTDRTLELRNGMKLAIPPNARRRLA